MGVMHKIFDELPILYKEISEGGLALIYLVVIFSDSYSLKNAFYKKQRASG